MPSYTGGCHCGRVRFEVSGQIDRVLDCNCSICRKKGFLHWIVEPEQFRLVSSADTLSLYEFHTKQAKHYFCSACGISSYYIPRSHPNMIDVNLRCVDGVNLEELEVERFNGQDWEQARADLDAQ